jgi:hypothetical protein
MEIIQDPINKRKLDKRGKKERTRETTTILLQIVPRDHMTFPLS